MKKLLTVLFILASVCANTAAGQNRGITFQVEQLSVPEKSLQEIPVADICRNLVFHGIDHEVRAGRDDGIIVRSDMPESLVNYGYNSFFQGVYKAYSDHRPLVLSPDAVWLLISQGFSRHVNNNAEELRHYFVDFSGKKELEVVTNVVTLDSGSDLWGQVFPLFTKQIADDVGAELVTALTCDFSTTTAVERVASEITVMEAMKPYFDYTLIFAGCGIPEITLLGTPEDWQKLVDKLDVIERYDLKWWTKELRPVLKKFVEASNGKVDKKFWKAMFKHHTKKKYGAPTIIDGWFIKFFPYDKKGNRNDLRQLSARQELPHEIVRVDLKYVNAVAKTEIDLELWAGFFGLEQDNANYTLTPKIGWMIRKKTPLPIPSNHRSIDKFRNGTLLSDDQKKELKEKVAIGLPAGIPE